MAIGNIFLRYTTLPLFTIVKTIVFEETSSLKDYINSKTENKKRRTAFPETLLFLKEST